MMSCDIDALSRYLDDELPLAERRCIDLHLAQCAACSHEVELLARNDKIIHAWGERNTSMPIALESRISRNIGRKRRFGPLLAFGKMMPAALGTSAAALLVLVTAALGGPYVQRGQGSAASSAVETHSALVKQSAPLIMNRRTQAIAAGNSVQQPSVITAKHLFDEN